MIDMKTMLINYALIHAIGLLGMVVMWMQNRKRLTGIDYFLASYAVQFAANLLVFLRGIAPDFVTIVFANGMYFAGVILLYVGLTHFVNRQTSQAHNYVMLIVFVLFDSLFTFIVPSLPARNIIVSLGLGFLYFQCAWFMFFRVDQDSRHIITRRLGYIFTAYCLLAITRVIVDIVSPPRNDLFRSSNADAWILAAHQTLFILLTFSLFLTNNRKLIANLKDDITRRERAEDALRESEKRFRDFTDVASDWFWEMDSELRYTFVSEHYERITQTKPEKMLGKTRRETCSVYMPEEKQTCMNLFVTLKERKDFCDFVYTHIRPDGQRRVLVNHGKAIFDQQGNFSGYRGVGSDITGRMQAEAEIARLATVIEQAAVTVVITDLEGDIVYANPAFEITTGYTVTEALGQNPRILKTDHQDASFYQRMWETITAKRVWNGVFVNKRKDGGLYHEQASIFPIKNAAGEIINYAAIKRDITEQVQIEQSLKESEERYRWLFENASDLVHSIAPDGSLIYANPAWKETLGYSDAEITNLSFLDIINPDEHEHCREIFQKVLSGESFDQLRTKFISKDGNSIMVEGNISGKLSDGRPVASMCFFRDIGERVQAEQQLQHAATHDPLTDLPNRVLFFDRLAQALAKAKRNEEQLAVLFIDLDDFKAINDTCGHHIGDQLLISFTGRLQNLFRKSDTVARLSGDEFALMLEFLSEPIDAARIAKKIISLCSKPYKLENDDVFITLSIGISIYPEDATDADTLVQRADAAMYQIKQQGKNSYRFFNESGND